MTRLCKKHRQVPFGRIGVGFGLVVDPMLSLPGIFRGMKQPQTLLLRDAAPPRYKSSSAPSPPQVRTGCADSLTTPTAAKNLPPRHPSFPDITRRCHDINLGCYEIHTALLRCTLIAQGIA